MLTVRREQLGALRRTVQAGFAAGVVDGLREQAPHAMHGLGDAEVESRLRTALRHAERLHIDVERDLRAFIRLCFLVGADFSMHEPFAGWLDPACGGGVANAFELAEPDDWERAAVRDVVDRYRVPIESTGADEGPRGDPSGASVVPLSLAHAEPVFRHGLHPDVWRLAGAMPAPDVESVRQGVDADTASTQRKRFAILDGAAVFAGVLTLKVHGNGWRLSYWIRRDRWGRGLAKRAIGGLLADDACPAARTQLTAQVLAGNQPSIGVLRALGFVEDAPAEAGGVRRFVRRARA